MKENPHHVRARWVALGLLVAVTLAVYLPVLRYEFNDFDDEQYVSKNRHVAAGLSAEGVRWACTTFRASNWHPLTWMSHMLDATIWGTWPGGHHLTNLLFHLANTCLLFLALEKMTGAAARSTTVAALFAVHPLHVESVAWVAERKDLLSAFFWLLTLLAYVRFCRARTPRAFALVAAVFALGLLSKPMIVTLPFTLLLLDYWPLARRRPWGELVREKIPLFVMSAAACCVTIAAQQNALGTLDRYPLGVRISNAVVSYGIYLAKTVWPSGLAVFYPHPGHIAAPVVLAAWVTLLAGVTLLALRFRATRPYGIVGWLWYLGTLVPAIGIVQVGRQAWADRYSYVPLIGIFIVVVWGGADALVARRRLLAPVLAAIVALAVASRMQLAHWQDGVSLFERAIAVADSDVARTNLGRALMNRGRKQEAEAQYRASLRINPNGHVAHNNLALLLEGDGRVDEARLNFEDAIRAKPGYENAHKNLARLLRKTGRMEASLEHSRRALAIDPDDIDTHADLGLALAATGRYAEALPHLELALQNDPRSAELHNNLGISAGAVGQNDDALRHFQEATRLKPDYALAHYNLATEWYRRGRYDDAWRELGAARALGFTPPEAFVRMLAAKSPRGG